MKYLFLSCLFLAACGSDSKFTWGDVSSEVSSSYCNAGAACGFSFDVNECIDHSYFHMCELEHTCGKSVDKKYEDSLDSCVKILGELDSSEESSFDCFLLGFGYLPEECQFLPEANPSN